MLWIEEYHQYAMWALGYEEDVRKRERLREPRSLLVRANPIDRASRLVGEICGAKPVPVSDGALMVAAGILRAGEINQKLVSSGIVVSELRPAGDSEKASSRN